MSGAIEPPALGVPVALASAVEHALCILQLRCEYAYKPHCRIQRHSQHRAGR